MAIDQNIKLDSVSIALGHSNTKTTESYYGRKRPEDAVRDFEAAYTVVQRYPDAKTPQIESKFEVTGYG
jgi:integrase